ncbi:MAG: undecaprenyl/decaprenyl-phosphate alpha-N-acetylglucosaminyl 1-phosphate transferase [Clostridia bacterium]|nr:undecaprenyl/decaprenyl-phosphate alpha-N-acetylglucosaminyl 1-phosphate transferase [Clostridia bacterium]
MFTSIYSMYNDSALNIIFGIVIAVLCAFFISIATTPVIRTLAFKFGVTDIPKDNRRMHSKEMPLMGGVAIFIAFAFTSLIFCSPSKAFFGMLIGNLIIVATGIIDDKYDMNPCIKLLLQIAAALVAVLSGNVIEQVNLLGHTLVFGAFAPFITIIWITAITNAVNLIDGLDGLSCGISTISAITLLLTLIRTDTNLNVVCMIAILVGSCLGFLPFNFNPARIFMGDTGALFLGYTLSVLSIQGCFKFNGIISFWIPLLIFALPLADTAFAFFRRIFKKQSPFRSDREHLHHRLIDKGFDQKHAVMILYAVSCMLGIAAIVYSFGWKIKSLIIAVCSILILYFNLNFSFERKDIAKQQDEQIEKDTPDSK